MKRSSGSTGSLKLEEVIPDLRESALHRQTLALHKHPLLSAMAQATSSAASWLEVDRVVQVLRLLHLNQTSMAHHSIKCPSLRLVWAVPLHLSLSRVVATLKDQAVHLMDMRHNLPNRHRPQAQVRALV